MANKRIQELPKVDAVADGDIFPLGRESAAYDAYGATGAQLTAFIESKGNPILQQAQQASNNAEQSKDAAASSATQANSAKEAAELAKGGAESAKTGAEAAKKSIEDMTVSAQEVSVEQPIAVEKSIVGGIVNLLFKLKAGPKGETGQKGDPGNSIQKIERTSGNGAPGTTDTYTITLTDGSTSTFQVYNGANGEGAGDMTAAVYDPTGKATDIYKYVDDEIAKIPTPDVSAQIQAHNISPDTHEDIRNSIPTTAAEVDADPAGSATQALADAKAYTDIKVSQIPAPDLSSKIDKVSPATNGNLPILTSDGQLKDSGKSIDDIGSGAKARKVTLTTTGWTDNGDGRKKQTVSVTGVTVDTAVVTVDCDLTTEDTNAKVEILTAWQGPSANDVTQGSGTLTFYCYEVPTVNIPVNVGVM